LWTPEEEHGAGSSGMARANVGAAMGIVAIGIEFRESEIGSMFCFPLLTTVIGSISRAAP